MILRQQPEKLLSRTTRWNESSLARTEFFNFFFCLTSVLFDAENESAIRICQIRFGGMLSHFEMYELSITHIDTVRIGILHLPLSIVEWLFDSWTTRVRLRGSNFFFATFSLSFTSWVIGVQFIAKSEYNCKEKTLNFHNITKDFYRYDKTRKLECSCVTLFEGKVPR